MCSDSTERWPARREPAPGTIQNGHLSAGKQDTVLHRAGELSYSSGGRESAYAKLGSNAQRELRSRVGGEMLEWWAEPVSQGFYAVALGPVGLCEAKPFTRPDRKKAYRMRLLRFTPDSLTQVTWTQTEEANTNERESVSSDQAAPLLACCLSSEFCGFLGNLPDKAQQLIQEIYAPRPDLAYSHYYEIESELSETIWYFWCYLADDQVLTFCSGSKVTQRAASPGLARWRATCYRAAIAPSKHP
jgi:hypothetical protein